MKILLTLLDRVRPVKRGPSRQYRAEVVRFLFGDWSERGPGGREYHLENAEGLVALHLDIVVAHEREHYKPSFAADAIGRLQGDRLRYSGALSAKRAR